MKTLQELQDENTALQQRIAELESQRLQDSGDRQLVIILDIEHALAASFNQQEIYEILQKGIHRLFTDIDTLLISDFDAQRGTIRAVYVFNEGTQVDVSNLPEIPLAPPGKGTQSQVIHTRQPLIIGDKLKERFRSSTIVRLGAPGSEDCCSALYVPMLAQEQVLGVIQLQSTVPNRFSNEDIQTLSLVARTASRHKINQQEGCLK